MANPKPAAERLEQAGGRARATADTGLEQLRAVLEFDLIPLGGAHVTVGGLVAAVLMLVAVWVVWALSRRALNRYGQHHTSVSQPALYTLSLLLHYVPLAMGILLALYLAGILVGKFTVFAGALGVGLGLGLQAIFGNFVSGLILLFDKSLKVGDFVELDADVRGTVRDINIRATRITTNDSIDILAPNSEFVTGRVVNWTHRDAVRRLRVSFAVAYAVDKELVRKAARVPFTLALTGPRSPQVWLVDFGDSAVEYITAVWLSQEATKRKTAIQAAYLRELDTSFKQHGTQIPFPKRDLNLRSVFGLVGDDAIALLRGHAGAPRRHCSPASAWRWRATMPGRTRCSTMTRHPSVDRTNVHRANVYRLGVHRLRMGRTNGPDSMDCRRTGPGSRPMRRDTHGAY